MPTSPSSPNSYVSGFIEVQPAFSRDYCTEEDVRHDWEENMDFQIIDPTNPWFGSYINQFDAVRANIAQPDTIKAINVRYADGTKLCVIQIGGE